MSRTASPVGQYHLVYFRSTLRRGPWCICESLLRCLQDADQDDAELGPRRKRTYSQMAVVLIEGYIVERHAGPGSIRKGESWPRKSCITVNQIGRATGA